MGRERQIMGAHWAVSIAKTVSFQVTKRPSFKITRQIVIKEDADVLLWSPLDFHAHNWARASINILTCL